jgi:hypothetical protein
MSKVAKRPRLCKRALPSLPLFAWADKTRRTSLPHPARWVATRCHVSAAVASVVAEHLFKGDQR